MVARSKDPLTAATTSILLPALRAADFQRKTNRVIARIQADILQFLDLQLSAYGGKDFCVNYASISLFRPRDYFVLQPGGRLCLDNGAEAWLSASTHEAANLSMRRVVEMVQAQGLPFFDSTKTVEGLLTHLQHAHWGSPHHLNLERASCAAKLNRLPDAWTFAMQAIELYRQDGRPWCMEHIDLCEHLLSSIRSNDVGDLLRRWTDHSIAKLRLVKLRRRVTAEPGLRTMDRDCGESRGQDG